jgi:predicted O-methyltransferase YrrM
MNWVFPYDVVGFLSPGEGQQLAELARGLIVLEIGSWQGRSTICMAQTARKVLAVDPHRNFAHAGNEPSLEAFVANLRRYGVEDKVLPLVGKSEEILPLLKPYLVDMVFVDGWHDLESIELDIVLATPILQPAGTWVFHDYGHAQFPAVQQCVDKMAARLQRSIVRTESLAVLPW